MKANGAALARLCRTYAEDKKAVNSLILDLREVNGPAEFFLICAAESEPQIKAIVNGIEQNLKEKHKISPWGVHGTAMSRWMVMDYSSVLVHVMHAEKRAYYRIEELWGDAERVN